MGDENADSTKIGKKQGCIPSLGLPMTSRLLHTYDSILYVHSTTFNAEKLETTLRKNNNSHWETPNS
jgi:hypothetical protein